MLYLCIFNLIIIICPLKLQMTELATEAVSSEWTESIYNRNDLIALPAPAQRSPESVQPATREPVGTKGPGDNLRVLHRIQGLGENDAGVRPASEEGTLRSGCPAQARREIQGTARPRLSVRRRRRDSTRSVGGVRVSARQGKEQLLSCRAD